MNFKHIFNYVTHFSVYHVNNNKYDAGKIQQTLMITNYTLGDSE